VIMGESYLWRTGLPARLNGDSDKIGSFADALLNLIPFRINQLQPAVHVLQSDAPSALVHVGLRIVAVLAQEDDFSLVFRDGYVYEEKRKPNRSRNYEDIQNILQLSGAFTQ